MAYVEAQDLTDYLRSTRVEDESLFDAARLVAESAIDSYCQRTFTVPTAATTRTFVPSEGHCITVPDIANTTNLVIVDNGSTLTASAYQLEISPGVPGPIGVSGRTWPYTRIRRLSGTWWQDSDGEATLSITARWGWPAIPAEVVEATKLIARDVILARDTSFGLTQMGDFSRRIEFNGPARSLLDPLRRVESWGIA